MKVYVVRHGQTDWNLEGKMQGKTDIELNQEGIEQAKIISEKINEYNIDLIVSSPLKRTSKTAEIINEKLKCDIILNKGLEERCFGIFEGKVRKDIQDEIINSHVIDNYYINKDYGEVEPIQELCGRVWGLLDELKNDYNDKNILLVTHSGTSRAINAYFEGINNDGMIKKVEIDNCGIKEYEV